MKLISFIKRFFSFSWFKRIKWNIFPSPNEKPLKSLAEIVFYLLCFCLCLWLYNKCNEVSYNEEFISVECLNGDEYINERIPQVDINYRMPMTNVEELDTTKEHLSIHFSTYNLTNKDKLEDKTQRWIMYCDSLKKYRAPKDSTIIVELARLANLDEKNTYSSIRSSIHNSPYNITIIRNKLDSLIKENQTNAKLTNVEKKLDSLIKKHEHREIPTYYYKCSQTIRKELSAVFFKPTNRDTILSDMGVSLQENYKENGKLVEESFILLNGYFFDIVNVPCAIRDNGQLSFGDPGWFAMSDISQGYYKFVINSSTIFKYKLSINFVGATEFSEIYPTPDVITMSGIEYTNPVKLEIIKNNGLNFHVVFKELVNRQTIRMFFLTAIISAMITVFFAYFIFILLRWFGVLSSIKRIKKEKKTLLLESKPNDNKK